MLTQQPQKLHCLILDYSTNSQFIKTIPVVNDDHKCSNTKSSDFLAQIHAQAHFVPDNNVHLKQG